MSKIRRFFILSFFFISSAFSGETGLQVHILQPLINALPNQVVPVQVEIMNCGCDNKIFVGHLVLPYGFEAIPSNDILLHMSTGQCSIQTILIRPFDHEPPGEYAFTYEVWARDNPSIMDRDDGLVVIGDQNHNQAVSLEITSPTLIEIDPGEVIYVSAIISNKGCDLFEGELAVDIPEGWQCTPVGPIPVSIEADASKLVIIGVKTNPASLAGEHQINLRLGGCQPIPRTVTALIKPKINIVSTVEGCRETHNLNQMVPLYVRYTNNSNVPLKVILETQTDPKCNLECASGPYEIPPYDSIEVPILIHPEPCELDFSQFLLVKLLNAETGEQLYQNPMTLKFVSTEMCADDPYIRIPAYVKGLVLGDRYKGIAAAEFAGGGLIDPEKERYLDFFFRLPTDVHHVIYNIDERLYFGVHDPIWSLDIGDTVYALSPLTQYYRYGRGANIEHFGEKWDVGLHYTQNTLKCEQDPHELCSYVQFNATERISIAANYLHKVEDEIPTSNILTLQSIIDFPSNFTTEIELGKNFIRKKKHEDNLAYRFETHGRLPNDTWFSLEKAYAGPRFYGYYNNLHLFSSAIDFPIQNRLRVNLNTSRIHQNFCLCDDEEPDAIIPKQRQYSATLTYSASEECSFALNGMLLRSKDLGETHQYNFYQKWAGFSFSLYKYGFNFNTIISIGQQKDYLTGQTTHNLQRYYAYISRDLSNKMRASIFYDSGNINYYDAKPWRSGFGGTLSYRFAPRGYFDLFFQKLKHTADTLDMTQIAINCTYTFRNLHRFQAMAQHFNYRSHYPNDTIVLISYSIPLTIPICHRNDIGHLNGTVYDSWNDRLVEGALINCGKSQTSSDADGGFAFHCLPRGDQCTEVTMLPDNLIETESENPPIEIKGGRTTSVCISVVPSCSIEGEIILYGYKDYFAMLTNPADVEIIPFNGLEGIRIAIAKEESDEIYSCLTNKKGYFQFPKLRPGRWHIKVFTDQIPSLHELNMNNLNFEVLPEENQKLLFKVMPLAPQVYKLE